MMRKRLPVYILASVLLILTLLFFNNAYRELSNYSSLINRHNIVHGNFHELSRQLNNAAAGTPELDRPDIFRDGRLFYSDSSTIINTLDTLKITVRDSINIQIAQKLDPLIRAELAWLLSNDLPDSLINNKSPEHMAAFRAIDSLLQLGVNRTIFLSEYRKTQLNEEGTKIRVWMTTFIVLSIALLAFITVSLYKEQGKTDSKDKELETVLNRISDGVVSVDTDWRYTFLNDAALEVHTGGKGETVGKYIWDVHPELKSTPFWDAYSEAMQTKKVVEMENYYLPLNTWFSIKAYPSEDGLTIFYKDITASKKIEEKLVKSEKIYKTIASSIPGSAICLFDRDYRFLLIEGDMIEKLGYTKKDLLGKTTAEVLPQIHNFLKIYFKKAFIGQTYVQEFSSNGFDIVSRFIPLKDENNTIYAVMTVINDITQVKKAEHHIAELNKDLEERIRIRTGELKKSNEEMEAFSYSVSHDLRAPLRGIIGFATILEEDYGPKLDDEARRVIDVIKRNTLRMGQLIDDLLAFSRAGKLQIIKTPVSMNEMVDEVIADLTQQNNRNDKITWVRHTLPTVMADTNMVRQVWVNFLTNAIKYSSNKEQQRIEINAVEKEGYTVFSVKDNGVGFNDRYKNKLFKVFQRLHAANEFEGTGVGLALVDKIVTKHGGQVWAEGKEGVGATFYFSLPIKDDENKSPYL